MALTQTIAKVGLNRTVMPHEGLKLKFNPHFHDVFRFYSTVIVPQKLHT
jgi:hypothetical protein